MKKILIVCAIVLTMVFSSSIAGALGVYNELNVAQKLVEPLSFYLINIEEDSIGYIIFRHDDNSDKLSAQFYMVARKKPICYYKEGEYNWHKWTVFDKELIEDIRKDIEKEYGKVIKGNNIIMALNNAGFKVNEVISSEILKIFKKQYDN